MPEVGTEEYYNEQLSSLKERVDNLVEDNLKLRAALLLIEDWSLPYKGFVWENGSNGEREHFRSIARKALNDAPSPKTK